MSVVLGIPLGAPGMRTSASSSQPSLCDVLYAWQSFSDMHGAGIPNIPRTRRIASPFQAEYILEDGGSMSYSHIALVLAVCVMAKDGL